MEETSKYRTTKTVCRENGEKRGRGRTEMTKKPAPEMVCRDKGEKQRGTETGNRNVPWAVAQTKREYVFSWVSINFHSAS